MPSDATARDTVRRSGAMAIPVTWKTSGKVTECRLGHLGKLVVRLKTTDFEVVVFHIPLSERSVSLEDGKCRALAAARAWTTHALRQMSAPDPCPKREVLGGCDYPACDCAEK